MFKLQKIREEDYWIYPISFFGMIATTLSIYASVLTFRAPAVILAILLLWFTTSKIRDGYSAARARVHLVLTLTLAVLLTLVIHILTN